MDPIVKAHIRAGVVETPLLNELISKAVTLFISIKVLMKINLLFLLLAARLM